LRSVGFVLFSGLPTQFQNFLLKFLSTLQSLLFKLLPAGGKVLLLFGDFCLNLLFNTGTLLACCLKKLLALLAGLIAEVINLTLGFLPNRGTINKLLTLALSLLNNLFGLLPCSIYELIPALNELCGSFNFLGKSLSNGIKNLDGIPFVNEATTGKWETTAFQYDLLELIKLIENGEPHVVHLSGVRKLN
jgi:hypothetical protein